MTDIFDDEKFLIMDSMPEHDAIELMWFKLLVFAGKSNNNGIFFFNDKVAYTDEMLASIFHRPVNTVRLALQTFENLGMIEIIDGVMAITNWGRHQTLDVYEKKKEQDRERTKRYREKQKNLIEKAESRDTSRDSHVTVTQNRSYSTSISSSCSSSRSKSVSNVELFNNFISDNKDIKDELNNLDLLNVITEWLVYKDEQKEHYKETSIKTLVKKVVKTADEYSARVVTDLIEDSISSGYKGIIWDKLKKETASGSGSAYLDRIDNRISDVDKWAKEIEERHKQRGETDDFFRI